jgi:hypothetical protein
MKKLRPVVPNRAAYTGVRMAFLNPSDEIIAFEQACLQAGNKQLEEWLFAFAVKRALPTTGDGWIGRCLALAALEHPMLNPAMKAGRPRTQLRAAIIMRSYTTFTKVEELQSRSRAEGRELSDREACRQLLLQSESFREDTQPFHTNWQECCNDVALARRLSGRTRRARSNK